MENKKKFVVLEHLLMPNKGIRFWSTNSDNNTHSAKGELWYKEVLFTDDADEAIEASKISTYPSRSELLNYISEQYKNGSIDEYSIRDNG